MSVQYNGKSPSRVWYALQKCKGIASAAQDKNYKGYVRQGAVQAGTSAVAAAGAVVLWEYSILGLGAVGAWVVAIPVSAFMGFMAYKSLKTVVQSNVAKKHLQQAEKDWVTAQKNKVSFGSKIRKGLLSAVKWTSAAASVGGLGAALAGGLELAGISVLPAAASTMLAGVGLGVATAASAGIAVIAAGVSVYCHQALRIAKINAPAAKSSYTPLPETVEDRPAVAAAKASPSFSAAQKIDDSTAKARAEARNKRRLEAQRKAK